MQRIGDQLTPDERGRLARNFKGYDISPDMVRLSLVNLYLHGFTDPHIFEYDSLTSQERWNETADVILANPPFMSPKGGIRPHNRFSVQSKRSEVLFVDYMAEHLTPNGRAGIIVPEGIIFQSQGAYKQLRKLLVEDYLIAVVSLPAGVFQPYSGVKTSILILDKSLARTSDSIAFFKVQNDGFGLGAQRRAIDKNDLPAAAAALQAFRHSRASGNPVDFDSSHYPGLLVVEKSRIAANGDYNLSGERYREGAAQSTHFPWRTIESLIETITPPAKIPKTAFMEVGRYPIIDQSQDAIAGWTNDESALVHPSKPLVIFGDHTCAVKIIETPFAQGADGIKILHTTDVLDPRFLFQVLRARPVESNGYQRHYSKLKELQIPLPPLEVQKEIVAQIEGYQKIIDGARAVLDHYRPHIPIHPDWPMVPIKEVAAVESGYGFPLDYQGKTDEEIPFLKVSDMNLPGNEKEIVSWNHSVSREVLRELKAEAYPKGTVIFPKIGAAIGTNKKRILMRDSTYDNNVMGIIPDTKQLLTDFLYTYLLAFDLSRWASDSQPPSMRKTTVEAHEIPLPVLATQQAIVAEIEAEQALVTANRELITRFEKKIQATLARVWDEEEPAPPEE